jgi:hypothetical protein
MDTEPLKSSYDEPSGLGILPTMGGIFLLIQQGKGIDFEETSASAGPNISSSHGSRIKVQMVPVNDHHSDYVTAGSVPTLFSLWRIPWFGGM